MLHLVHDPQPELGALCVLDPGAESLLCAVGQDAGRNIDDLVAHEAFIPDLHADRIEEDKWTDGVERLVLPFRPLLQHSIGDGRDQIGQYVDAVALFQVVTDLANRHAARVRRDDPVVELREAALILAISFGANVSARSRGIESCIFDVPVSTVFFECPLRRLARLSVSRSSSRCCFLQIVEQAVPGKHRVRLAAGQ